MALEPSWNQTRGHFDAARALLTGLPGIDLSATLEFLEYNELGLAFDCLVDHGAELDLPLSYWQRLDRAARVPRRRPEGPAARGLRPIRLHDARHGCAALLTAAGVAPRVVMEILGHSQISLTMDVYTHVVQDTQREAISHTDRLLTRKRPDRRRR